MRIVIYILMTALAGCEEDLLPEIPDAALPMAIHGTATEHDITDTGVVDRADDLSAMQFISITPTKSGFEHHVGIGSTDGTFVVPVGFGASTWDLGATVNAFDSGGVIGSGPPTFLVGSTTSPDFSRFHLGRGDASLPKNTTTVTVNASGLNSWQTNDDLEIMASNAGAIIFSPHASFATPLAAGATTIAQSFAWPVTVPLVDAGKGDATVLFQDVTQAPGTGVQYRALAKLGTATQFTTTDGAPAIMNVVLADVPRTETLTLHFKHDQFEALAPQIGPGAIPSAEGVFIDALPGAATRGFFAGAPDLVECSRAGFTDLDIAFTYANPFTTMGTAWDEWVIAYEQFTVPVLAPGATLPFNFNVYARADLPVAGFSSDGNITPQVTPVRNIRIGGMDLRTPQTGVGLTPTVTWDAPTTGTVTNYGVSIYRVVANGTATDVELIANFVTRSGALQIPDMILANLGSSYMLAVTAYADPGADFTVAPFLNGLPDPSTVTLTAQFTP